ncbi:MAG TPA: hypothetical protein VFC17_03435 [Candidatus Limnocylindrales bacterium]|nr:hypothetical protein [Candidatus Limnocylindrales bacterium]
MPVKRPRSKKKTKWGFLKHPLFVGISVVIIGGLLTYSLKTSSTQTSTIDGNVANSNTVNISGNNSGQVAGGNLINQTVINSNNQSMADSPGGMQAGRDINIHSAEQQYSGILTPDNEPDPTPFDVPNGAVKIFLGNVRSYSSAMDADHIVLFVRTNKVVWFRRTHNGLYFSADIFRSNERGVAKIRDNRWEVNPNNYYEILTNTPHELKVTDKDGVLLRCRYLNENAVQIEGRFQFSDFPSVVITTNQIFVGARPFSSPMFGDNYIDLLLN